MMRDQIEQRLKELEAEFATGARRLQEVDRQAAELREALLRIGGAVTVLREVLASGGSQDLDGAGVDVASTEVAA